MMPNDELYSTATDDLTICIGEVTYARAGPGNASAILATTQPGAPSFEGSKAIEGNFMVLSPAEWAELCDDAGLRFLLRPEQKRIDARDVDAISVAVQRRRETLPAEIQSGWKTGLDRRLAQLLWMHWWMTWSLQHCREPTIVATAR
jgi:hypothetical protein